MHVVVIALLRGQSHLQIVPGQKIMAIGFFIFKGMPGQFPWDPTLGGPPPPEMMEGFQMRPDRRSGSRSASSSASRSRSRSRSSSYEDHGRNRRRRHRRERERRSKLVVLLFVTSHLYYVVCCICDF